ncbi:MAG: hypothetical protein M3Y72_19240 [Acidobacteriota bacterium]|nr:hypothetical protein [Acidobacteriota bacterium]MDQ2843129.1 hypothetical protein [Acidobacteriota bacterium]
MPRLPPFALAESSAQRNKRPYYILVVFALFTAPLLALHLHLLTLPFFWDELGQFIPTALDLLRTGAWVAHSTIPNVHPPGVEMYLVLCYKLFGFSIPVTRVAILFLAGAGLVLTFLLAIELSSDSKGAPAFWPPLFLFASPLFYMQSMMAQLDMPAMVLTLLALWFFLKERYAAAAVACIFLVLAKETGLVLPAVFFVLLLLRKDGKRALFFVPSGLVLVAWLVLLRAKTGFWLGNPGFAHYNVEYALNPVRILFSLLRRIYYLFFAEFRWIGSVVLLATLRQCKVFRAGRWRVTLLVSVLTVILVSVLGGAELERYLLPVLPIFYIAVSIGLMFLRRWLSIAAAAALIVGLAVNLFWNPPYPFPYENNYAMVDFVRLQRAAAAYAEHALQGRTILTAWPYSAALKSSDYGFVTKKLPVIQTDDFHLASIKAVPRNSYDALIVYTRTWMPERSFVQLPLVKRFLSQFYGWKPMISPIECEALGLTPVATWVSRGQEITVYVRPGSRARDERRDARIF